MRTTSRKNPDHPAFSGDLSRFFARMKTSQAVVKHPLFNLVLLLQSPISRSRSCMKRQVEATRYYVMLCVLNAVLCYGL